VADAKDGYRLADAVALNTAHKTTQVNTHENALNELTTDKSLRSAAQLIKPKHLSFISDLDYAGFVQTAVLAAALSTSGARKILKEEYHLSAFSEGMIAASLSLGMATGQYLFGEYSDQLGANKTGQIAALIACAGGLISSAQIFPHPG
jgi:hypothetical protein